ncbi:MAG: hypothetical protein IJ651_02800 [Bacteroidales bacterium]|nr:hypothetical protein [Bacteroidales bacterium]
MKTVKRQVFGILLLAVFLPAFAISVFHTHPQIHTDGCSQCVRHLPHAGHLNIGHQGLEECVLCHFLTLPQLPASELVLLPFNSHSVRLETVCKALHAELSFPFAPSRAPPVTV